MTHETWLAQKARLIDRFGERNFSKEFSLLVAQECRPMPDHDFVAMVNAMIGGRRPNDPPLIKDFRDARLAWEKRRFDRDAQGANRTMTTNSGRPVLELLKPYVGAVKNVKEAVEVRAHQIAIAKANDPDYHPMGDKKFMGEHAWTRKADGKWGPPDDNGPEGAA